MTKVDDTMSSDANLMAAYGKHEFDTNLPEDIFNLTAHVECDYHEILSDPPMYKKTSVGGAISPIIETYGVIFNWVQAGTYYVFALLLGWLFAIVWGIVMGINTFIIIWMCQPMWKIMFTAMRLMYLLNRALFRIICDPFMQSCSLIFSNMKGHYRFTLGGFLPIITGGKSVKAIGDTLDV